MHQLMDAPDHIGDMLSGKLQWLITRAQALLDGSSMELDSFSSSSKPDVDHHLFSKCMSIDIYRTAGTSIAPKPTDMK